MADLQYGVTTFEQTMGNMPALPVVNMYVEKAEPEGENPVLQSRPGLSYSGPVYGAGPITGLFSGDAVFSGSQFIVSGGNLYKAPGTLTLGAIGGVGFTKMAAFAGTPNRLFITKGSSLYEYNGTTLATVATPGSFSVQSLCVATDRLIVVDAGTGHYYWSDVLSDNIQALSFATAEQSPDNLLDVLFVGDTLILFGSQTVEFWPASSANPNLPFVPLIGKTQSVGIYSTGACTKFGNTFAWVTNTGKVCVGNAQTVVSTRSLEEQISTQGLLSLWRFFMLGVEFLAATLGGGETWVFSSHSSQWSTFASDGQSNWIPTCYDQYSNNFGGMNTGQPIIFNTNLSNASTFQDFGGTLNRTFRAGQPITAGTVPLFNLTLRTNPGQTGFTVGTYANPVVNMRTSKDGGNTWSPYYSQPLGAQGKYRQIVSWKSMGYFGYPSMLLEFQCDHPVPFRVSGIDINSGYADINV